MKDGVMTVSECLSALNEVLHTQVVVVEGEINTYNVSQGKWVFFSLVDEDSKLECFSILYKISKPLEPGMQVRVVGVPNVHKRSGKFSLTVESIELVGEGALQRAFEMLKRKLEIEGLFEISRKRKIDKYPTKIALIASESSAAYTDFIKVINNRWRGLEIYLLDTSVQGNQAIGEIEEAFVTVNESPIAFDAIVLTRGGGSLEDLHAFNDERVARAVARSRIPVICAVGHERDITIADLVADIRAATPSNAAEILVRDRISEIKTLRDIQKLLVSRSTSHLVNQQHKLKYSISVLLNKFAEQKDRTERFKQFFSRVVRQIEIMVSTGYGDVASTEQRIVRNQRMQIKKYRQEISDITYKLKLLNPKKVLERGYSLAYSTRGLVKSAKDVKPGEGLQIQVSDGNIHAIVSDK